MPDPAALPIQPPVPWLEGCPPERWALVRGLLTDIDDTLTRDGAIEPVALTALQQLQEAGIPVIAITGRPMGWSQPFARDWPLVAIVAENGAVALWREGAELHIDFAQDEATRTRNAQRLREVAARIQRQVCGALPARDSPGRVTDIAIDHSEFTHLPPQAIAEVVALMQTEGMVATVSSIHINGWFGAHSKRSGAQWMVGRLLGQDTESHPEQWLYVGDSTNDQTMFAHFPFSVGVANLLRFADALTQWPAYLTRGERGAGFAQVAQALLQRRQG